MTEHDCRMSAKNVRDLIHAKFASSFIFTYITDFLCKFEVADLFEGVEVGDCCCEKAESEANLEHASEADLGLQSLYKQSSEHCCHAKCWENVAVDHRATFEPENPICDDWDHWGHWAVTHEGQTDDNEVSVRVENSPMHGYQPWDLDAKYNRVNGFEVVVV